MSSYITVAPTFTSTGAAELFTTKVVCSTAMFKISADLISPFKVEFTNVVSLPAESDPASLTVCAA